MSNPVALGLVRMLAWSQHLGRTSTSNIILCQMEWRFASRPENSFASPELGNS